MFWEIMTAIGTIEFLYALAMLIAGMRDWRLIVIFPSLVVFIVFSFACSCAAEAERGME